jgi:hypothetical protein
MNAITNSLKIKNIELSCCKKFIACKKIGILNHLEDNTTNYNIYRNRLAILGVLFLKNKSKAICNVKQHHFVRAKAFYTPTFFKFYQQKFRKLGSVIGLHLVI